MKLITRLNKLPPPCLRQTNNGPRFCVITPAYAGVYYILNTFNNVMYVGQAQRIDRRWYTHVTTLNKGTHINKVMQADWQAFGAYAFEFGVLVRHHNDSSSQLIRLENVFMRTYQTRNPIYGYNAYAI